MERRPWRAVCIVCSLIFSSFVALLSRYILRDLPSVQDRLNPSGLDVALFARQASGPVLDVFQVHEPVLTPAPPRDQYGCVYTELLMEHSFAFSYGIPYVGELAQQCPHARESV